MQKPPWCAIEVSCKKKKKNSLSITCADSTVNSWHDAPPPPFASSHWASHPSVSVFCAVMATAVWQVLGRREGWAVGKRPGFYKEDGRRARARNKDRDAWWKAKSALVQKRRGSIYLPLSLLEGTMLLSCLADLKSAKPSICVETRSCLLNNRPACTMCVHFIHQGSFFKSRAHNKDGTTSCQQHKEELKILIVPFDPQLRPMKRINRQWKCTSIFLLVWWEGRVCVFRFITSHTA